jgi:hypothetical protein
MIQQKNDLTEGLAACGKFTSTRQWSSRISIAFSFCLHTHHERIAKRPTTQTEISAQSETLKHPTGRSVSRVFGKRSSIRPILVDGFCERLAAQVTIVLDDRQRPGEQGDAEAWLNAHSEFLAVTSTSGFVELALLQRGLK